MSFSSGRKLAASSAGKTDLEALRSRTQALDSDESASIVEREAVCREWDLAAREPQSSGHQEALGESVLCRRELYRIDESASRRQTLVDAIERYLRFDSDSERASEFRRLLEGLQ